MTRAVGHMKKMPRAYAQSEASIEHWLTDRCWLLRRVVGPGTEDGAPISAVHEIGPYACKVSEPVNQEEHAADREQLRIAKTIAIASDVRPLESDDLRVESEGEVHDWEIDGTVNPRPAPWGSSPLYNAELRRTREY